MEHTGSQEQTWRVLSETLKRELRLEYAVDEITSCCLKFSRSAQPTRAVILNFCGEDISINYEEARTNLLPKPSVGSPVRVNEDGTLTELSDNSVVTMCQVASKIRSYLAAA